MPARGRKIARPSPVDNENGRQTSPLSSGLVLRAPRNFANEKLLKEV
jgi:hypothetical protein